MLLSYETGLTSLFFFSPTIRALPQSCLQCCVGMRFSEYQEPSNRSLPWASYYKISVTNCLCPVLGLYEDYNFIDFSFFSWPWTREVVKACAAVIFHSCPIGIVSRPPHSPAEPGRCQEGCRRWQDPSTPHTRRLQKGEGSSWAANVTTWNLSWEAGLPPASLFLNLKTKSSLSWHSLIQWGEGGWGRWMLFPPEIGSDRRAFQGDLAGVLIPVC